MANMPTTPRHHSEADASHYSAYHSMSTGRTEVEGNGSTIMHPDSGKSIKPPVGSQGSESSEFHKDAKLKGSDHSPAVVRFRDVMDSPTSGLNEGSTRVPRTGSRLNDILTSPWRRRERSTGGSAGDSFEKQELELSDGDSTEDEESTGLSPAPINCTPRIAATMNEESTGPSPAPVKDAPRITAKNAQLFLKPNACVFVANLDTAATDAELIDAITKVFSRFGNVWVKVRRDPKGMPYAFCQFESREIAERAIRMGNNVLILGRECRTEPAKVPRIGYLSRTDGQSVSDLEAVNLLNGYGPLETTWRCTETEKEVLGLPEGLWVKFQYYDHCRLAINGLKDNKLYRLESYKLAGLTATVGGLPTPITGSRSAQNGATEFVRRKNADDIRASIFVGNLDESVGVPNILGMFCIFGDIKEVVIVSRQTISGPKTHAFVEYADRKAAVRAVNYEGHNFNGTLLRVEFKMTSEHTTVRSMPQRHAGSPGRHKAPIIGRQKDMGAKANGTRVGAPQASSTTARAVPVAPAALPSGGYYPMHGVAYGNLGIANPNVSVGPSTAGYTQGGMFTTPMNGPGLGLNGHYVAASTPFGPFAPYGPVGNPSSPWMYSPNGPYQGYAAHHAPRDDQ